MQWVRSLGERDFVGTESRLNTIFDLLRQIVFGTETDPQARIEELRRQQRALDDEIIRIGAGDLGLLDASGVRDRYQQLAATARELLSDFREVEDNFRRLDRQLREKITGWQGGKGELLDDVLGSRESIAGSDQGRSFQAFHDFLLSAARQEELSGLLAKVHEITEATAERDPRLKHVHYDWLDAARSTQATVRQPAPLRENVRAALRRESQVGLAALVRAAPLTHGVAELVAYLSLRDEAFAIVYDEASAEQISWAGPDGQDRTATLPRVTFTRGAGRQGTDSQGRGTR